MLVFAVMMAVTGPASAAEVMLVSRGTTAVGEKRESTKSLPSSSRSTRCGQALCIFNKIVRLLHAVPRGRWIIICRSVMPKVSCTSRSTPVAQSAPRNLLTRWDVSSIPANGIFLTKN